MIEPENKGVLFAHAIALGFCGLVVGGVVSVLALGMSGGGHGWNSAFLSSASLVGAPLAGVAWALRRGRVGAFLSAITLLGALALDCKLVFATADEGVNYMKRIWNSYPGLFVLWGAMFASWQVVAAAGLFTWFKVEPRL